MRQTLHILFILLVFMSTSFAQDSNIVVQVPFLFPDTSEAALSARIEAENLASGNEVAPKEEKENVLIAKFKKKVLQKVLGAKGIKLIQQAKAKQKRSEVFAKRLGIEGLAALDSTFQLKDDIQIFGWHPHWSDIAGTHSTYKYELLTTISYFSYDINPETGSYRTPENMNGWKNTTMITEAQAKGCDVLLSITNFGQNNNRSFLDNPNAQQRTIDSLVYFVELRGGNGIDIDFENIPPGYKMKFTAFVQKLSRTFKNKNKDYIISMAIPAVDHTDAFDIPVLNEYVDLFVIMGYDYHTQGTSSGPIAPLPPKDVVESGYNLANSVDYYLGAGVDSAHLILGLPHYGTVWESNSSNFTESQYVNKLSYAQLMQKWGSEYTPTFDSLSTSYYFLIKDTLNYKKCWFDTPHSLGIKYDYILDKGIGGAGIWALGYDGTHEEMWIEIATKFQKYEEPPEPFTLAGHLKRNHQEYITAILFFICFAVSGVIYSLRNEEFRLQVIESSMFQITFIITIIGIILTLLMLYDWINGQSLILLLGLLIGYTIMQFDIPMPNFKRRYVP